MCVKRAFSHGHASPQTAAIHTVRSTFLKGGKGRGNRALKALQGKFYLWGSQPVARRYENGGFSSSLLCQNYKAFLNSAVDYVYKTSTIAAQVQPLNNIFIMFIHSKLLINCLYIYYLLYIQNID
jgi:hypothetical protein